MISYRKINTAGSSFVVSLPKTWAKANNINIGDSVVAIEDGNRLILMLPKNVAGVRVEIEPHE